MTLSTNVVDAKGHNERTHDSDDRNDLAQPGIHSRWRSHLRVDQDRALSAGLIGGRTKVCIMIMSTTKGHGMNWEELIADLESRGELEELEGMLADWLED